MEIVSLLKLILAPAAGAALISLVAAVLLVRYLGTWRAELLRAITREVQRDLGQAAPEVRVSGQVSTTADDPYVPRSVCELHQRQMGERIGDLTGRVERLERRLDQDICRLHERVDEMPQRVVELIKPLLRD